MALADYQTNSWVSPQGGGDFNIHDVGTSQRYAIGTRIIRADGNEFVYAHCLTAAAPGVIVGPDISEGGEVAGVDNALIAPASAAAVPGTSITAGSIGSRHVQMTNAGIVADEHAGGYLAIIAGTGSGYTYRIKGNGATDDVVSGDVVIELYDPIKIAIDATSDVHVMGSKYAQCLEASGAGGENNLAVGVAQGVIAANGYGWLCVKGVTGVMIDGTVAAGEAITLTDNTGASAGWAQVAGGGSTAVVDLIDERVIGQCIIPDASAGMAMCQVNFD